MHTPFGTIYTTNLTPDVLTGIGAWSLTAFVRAMREGISRDGHRLYPAFPFTSFARMSDDDLGALYVHLMVQPAIRAPQRANDLSFPFNQRPLMALWTGLFHDTTPYRDDTTQSATWNRGAYLVQGVAHCGACHTGRNALGAEKTGAHTFGGAMIDGWEAPALTALSHAPVSWSENELFLYLRHGHSQHHGSVAGPMAPVVSGLQQLPEADVRAMATYLASFNPPATDHQVRAETALAQAQAQAGLNLGTAQRLFEGACGACHHDGAGDGNGPQVFGLNLPLALYSSLHSERPDNLVQAVLEGVREPATPQIGFMPAFKHSLSDAQSAELVACMRQRCAPGKPAWPDPGASVARLRADSATTTTTR